jgi:hypothetical protein
VVQFDEFCGLGRCENVDQEGWVMLIGITAWYEGKAALIEEMMEIFP